METPTGPTRDHNLYIGASDIGAIAGQNPYRSALDVWATKLNKAPRFKGNIHTQIGQAFERPALDIYAKHKGVKLTFPGTLVHPVDTWAGATPDAIADGVLCAECKMVGYRAARNWGEPEDGPDGVPPDYLCQVHWQSWIARVKGIARCEVAEIVAFRGTDMLIYEIPIDEVLVENLRDVGYEFWKNNLVGGTMPEIEGDSAKDILNAIHPRNKRADLDPMTGEVALIARDFDEQRARIKGIKKEQGLNAARLASLVGDGIGYEGDGIKVTWKAGKGSVSWKSVAEALGHFVDRSIYDKTIKDNTPERGDRKLTVAVK